MKRLIPFLTPFVLAFAASLQAGQLEFETKLIEVLATPDQELVTADFKFSVAGGEQAQIERYDAPCSCLEAQISDNGKLLWEVGEKGTVRGLFKVGNFRGTVDKEISVIMKDGVRHDLTVRMTMPELLVVEPKTLKWKQDEEPVAKSFEIKVPGKTPVKILGLSGTSEERFPYLLETLKEGFHYRLTVTPKTTADRGMGVIRIATDSEFKKHQNYQAFVVIDKPDMAPAKIKSPRKQ